MPVLLKTSDLRALGWTTPLIRSLLGTPDEKENASRGIYRVERFWYDQKRVEEAMRRPEFLLAQKKRKARAAAPAKRIAGFAEKYPTWRAAVADACHGMHSLNRYCKQACSEINRLEIYNLKNVFVQVLYERGYCSACWEHVLVLPPKKCRQCGGTGNDDGQGWCDHCGGSGNFLPEKRLRFFCFRFNVGRGYTWHQPDNLVKFKVAVTAPPAEWSGVEREKLLGMPKSQLAAAKDLVRWVIERAKEKEAVVEFIEEAGVPVVGVEQGSLFG